MIQSHTNGRCCFNCWVPVVAGRCRNGKYFDLEVWKSAKYSSASTKDGSPYAILEKSCVTPYKELALSSVGGVAMGVSGVPCVEVLGIEYTFGLGLASKGSRVAAAGCAPAFNNETRSSSLSSSRADLDTAGLRAFRRRAV